MNSPSLVAYLAALIVGKATRKRMFSGPYVFFGDYIACGQFLFDTGAVLGYTFHEKIAVFAELFAEQGRSSDVVNYLEELAARRLAAHSSEPTDMMELFSQPEIERIVPEHGKFTKVAKQKLPLTDSLVRNLALAAAEGIALGSQRPKLTERLLSCRIGEQEWEDARSHGLDIPASPPQMKSIRERQTEAIAIIRPYVEKVRPDLLVKLGYQGT
jgi:hypothetical protein